MGCVCLRKGDISFDFQTGNNTLIEFTHIHDGVITDIEPSFDIIYGVYDMSSGARIMDGSYRAGGRITRQTIGVYYFQLSHEDTENLVGTYKLEVTFIDRNDRNAVKVAHANQLIYMTFEPRQNNDLI